VLSFGERKCSCAKQLIVASSRRAEWTEEKVEAELEKAAARSALRLI
jgi:hypothetical protein